MTIPWQFLFLVGVIAILAYIGGTQIGWEWLKVTGLLVGLSTFALVLTLIYHQLVKKRDESK